MSFCENLLMLRILRLLYTGINVIRFVVPFGLIIKLSIDVYHAILMGEEKRIKELSFRRIVAAVMVFFSPLLVNLVLKLVEVGGGNSVDYPYCLTSIENILQYEEMAKIKQELKNVQKTKKDNDDYQKALYEQAMILLEQAKQNLINDSAAAFLGQKYSLSDDELRGLCGVAKAEQGSIEGAKAEASLMANLYELLSNSSRYYGTGLYNYVRNGGWFSNASRHMEQGCPSDYLNAVRDVLVNGNRTLPFYVNEHDCFNCSAAHACGSVPKGDVCKIVTNGVTYSSINDIKNRNNYVKDNTKVYTYYTTKDGSNGYWVFHSFPASNSDPFGYFESTKARIEGMNN